MKSSNGRKIPEELVEAIRKLYLLGHKVVVIEHELGVSSSTILRCTHDIARTKRKGHKR